VCRPKVTIRTHFSGANEITTESFGSLREAQAFEYFAKRRLYSTQQMIRLLRGWKTSAVKRCHTGFRAVIALKRGFISMGLLASATCAARVEKGTSNFSTLHLRSFSLLRRSGCFSHQYASTSKHAQKALQRSSDSRHLNAELLFRQ